MKIEASSASGRIAGKVALVTGVESDIGLAICRRFVAEGACVAGCVGSGQRQSLTIPEATASFSVLEGDLCSGPDAERIVAAVVGDYGRLDVLVNYAAALRVVGTIADVTDAEFTEELDAHLKAVIVLSRVAIRAMVEAGRGGSIINLSSIAREGVKGRALRSASKAALATLTRSMALDHGEQGIRVNGLLIGPTLTADIGARPRDVERMTSETILGQLNTAEDVAAAALFFASDEAARITGALLTVDAGRSLPRF